LAEKLRAAGYGIPAFFTSTGLNTIVEEGLCPVKFSRDGKSVEKYSKKR